jgi:membrane-associated phospholipid phosphatase
MRLGVRFLLLSSAACALVFMALLIGVYHTPTGRWLDNAALEGFLSALSSSGQTNAANAVAALCDPAPYAVFALAILATALVQRRPRRAAAAALVLGGSAVTTQLLKPALAKIRLDETIVGSDHFIHPHIGAPAFPSGHATAAMAIVLAALIVAPRALRPLVAAGGALFALAVGFSIIALGWHMPSDIVGGYLVATIWCLTALAALRAIEARWPESGTIRAAARSALPTAVAPAAAVIAAAAVAVGLARVEAVARFAGAYTAATVAVIGISLCAAALVTAVSLADSRPR